jgi:hypothetical protein
MEIVRIPETREKEMIGATVSEDVDFIRRLGLGDHP